MSDEPAEEQPAQADAPELDYETARDELAEVVKKLEAGGLSLEDSLTLWERGENLATLCERHLAGAQERVEAALSVVVDETAEADEPDQDG